MGRREQPWAGVEMSSVTAGCRAGVCAYLGRRRVAPTQAEPVVFQKRLLSVAVHPRALDGQSQGWHEPELSASPMENALGLPEGSPRQDSETRTCLKCVASLGEAAGIGRGERLLIRNTLDN